MCALVFSKREGPVMVSCVIEDLNKTRIYCQRPGMTDLLCSYFLFPFLASVVLRRKKKYSFFTWKKITFTIFTEMMK